MALEAEEEMVETEEDDEESGAGGSGSSCSSPASAPASQKPPRPFVSSNCSPSSDPLRRKTRDFPDVYICHSCGLRFPERWRRNRLQLLDSQWRLVLVCRACLRAIRSAEVCSYCFTGFRQGKEGGISCRRCSARVHLGCVPRLRGFLAAYDVDPDLFVCIDCCALLRSPIKKPGIANDYCATRATSVSLEDVVVSANLTATKKRELAETAKKKALAKVAAAKCAAQLAISALGFVVGKEKIMNVHRGNCCRSKLSLQLTLSRNSAPRFSINLYPDDSARSTDCSGGRTGDGSVVKGSKSVDCHITKK